MCSKNQQNANGVGVLSPATDTIMTTGHQGTTRRKRKVQPKTKVRKIARLMREIKRVYPNIPPSAIVAIRRKCKNNVPAFKSKNLTMNQKVDALVISHIRHTYTNYDGILKETLGTYEERRLVARKSVSKQISNVLREWQ